MKNQELAKIFREIADYLKMEKVDFKPFVYERAANTLEAIEEDVENIYKRGGKKAFEKLPGVGQHIAGKIEEYLKTGEVDYLSKLKKKTPIKIEELIAVEGLGPKRVKVLYQKLDIRNLQDLERAAKKHKISPLFGFDEKTEKNILEGIKFLKRSKGRFLLGDILPTVKVFQERLSKLKEVERVDLAGSVRRMKETIGDVDLLVISSNPSKVMDFFVKQPEVVKIWAKGLTKSSVRAQEGFDIDIRVLSKKNYGSALQYFTGSKEHNIATRRIAMGKGLKLSEYGLFRGKKMIAGATEESVYKALGMLWPAPELRENQGEVEAALKGKLPEIIGYGDILGDLHCHSDWDGGKDSIADLIQAGRKMGYQYLGVSDHTKFLRIEHGLNEKQLFLRNKEIDRLNQKIKSFRVLKGAETNVLSDGSIDINDKALKELDYAIAGVHSAFKMDKEKMTERIIRALKNPHINILSHPTGRILKKRDEYQCDFDKILRAARECNVVLEINAHPQRLDLNDQNIRRAKEAGVKMVISTDSHQKNQMKLMEFGIAQARRGWAEKSDIINSRPLETLLKFFNA